jgi:serine/threonine-protein kinase
LSYRLVKNIISARLIAWGKCTAMSAPTVPGENLDPREFARGLAPCLGCGERTPCGSAEPLAVVACRGCGAPTIRPLRIRNYWLYQPLGGGGMGSVYKAVQEGTGTKFAVKVLSRKGRSNPDFIRALRREGEAGLAIGRHPNVVAMVEVGQEGPEHFAVSEFAPRERLDQLIGRQGQLPEGTALEVCRQLVAAEVHICRQGYLFRDMKPENVMFAPEEGVVRLFDYGLCLPLATAAAPHAAGDELEGSPFYLPPERIVGAPEGEYSEVYSLGMLLFYMLTGRTYYSQADLEKLVVKHVSSLRVSSVGNRLQHCSTAFTPLIDKMIARAPNQRYPNLASLQQALAEVAATGLRKTGPVVGPPPAQEAAPAPAAPGFAWRKHLSLLCSLAAALVVAAVAILVVQYRLKVKHVEQTLREETARGFGVSAQVPAPALPVEEVEALVARRIDSRFAERAQAIPNFDPKEAERKLREEHGLGATCLVPTKTIPEIDMESRRGGNREALLRANGYLLVDQQWLPQTEALKLLLDKRQKDLTRTRQVQLAKLLKEVEKETREDVFRQQGYVWHENRWQEARAVIDRIVASKLESSLANH